ncbi:MAG: CocE/NonD family hydrolase [Streptosporangiaceae bacterium]
MVFGRDWATSPRRFRVTVDRDVRIPLSDGAVLVGDLFRPDTDEPVPVIAGFHPYNNEFQADPMMPAGFSVQRGWLESGDPYFFARRGYAHGVFNVRGTGKSTGLYQAMGPLEARDGAQAVQWLAAQPWCTGKVGMFGISYLAWHQIQVAMLAPPALAAIFAPFGATDFYRDLLYHGGIFSWRFLAHWKDKFDGLRYESWYRERHGEQAYLDAIAVALSDDEIAAVPPIVGCLKNPHGANAFVTDIVLARTENEWFAERRVDYDRTEVPGYFGACWGLHGLHLPAAFRSFGRWQGPKKLVVGPPLYLDRPFYQMHHEALRWFDHWLAGHDTGFLAGPPVQLFVPGTAEWKPAPDWPLPQTRWTEFYLHQGGLLSEHDSWPQDRATSFEDSPFGHGEAVFRSPPLVETTEIIGPMVLQLYASTTDTDALFFVTAFAEDADGQADELTRGWLRASQAAIDPGLSTPWLPYHRHDRREPVQPNQVRRYEIPIVPAAVRLRPGQRLRIRIKAADDEPPADMVRGTAVGHVSRPNYALITVHHDEEHPSVLLVPVTEGNLLGTFVSGGVLSTAAETVPAAKIARQKAGPA